MRRASPDVLLLALALWPAACGKDETPVSGATTPPGATSQTSAPATTPPAGGASTLPAFSMPADKDLTTTTSGLKYQVLRQGSGARPSASDVVTVHYAGWLADGTNFDSSFAHGGPLQRSASEFVTGLTEGLLLMPVGSIYKFVIPAGLAYADRPPSGSGIPKGALLVFQMELLQIGA